MEVLMQAGMAVFWICVAVFIGGILLLISSKGKSKAALRMIIIPAIIVVAMILIRFGTCVLLVLKH